MKPANLNIYAQEIFQLKKFPINFDIKNITSYSSDNNILERISAEESNLEESEQRAKLLDRENDHYTELHIYTSNQGKILDIKINNIDIVYDNKTSILNYVPKFLKKGIQKTLGFLGKKIKNDDHNVQHLPNFSIVVKNDNLYYAEDNTLNQKQMLLHSLGQTEENNINNFEENYNNLH